MVGVGESYFAAFVLAKHLGEVQAGLITTIPLVLGALLPLVFVLIDGRAISDLKFIKRWVIWSVLFQIISLMGFMVIGVVASPPVFLIYSLATIYFAAGFTAAPSWNYWMGALVAKEDASHFFADRLRFTQLGLFIGLLAGGQILHFQTSRGGGSWGFAVLFLLAAAARLVSLRAIWHQPDWSVNKLPDSQGLVTVLRGVFSYHGSRKFFLFLFLFYMMIYISSPFVSPFFLAELELSYQHYMIALGALLVGKAASLPWGTRAIKKYGVKTVFWIGALGISPLPAVWAFSRSFELALLVQFTSGLFWALFELAFSVIFFSHLKPQEKISLLSVYNLFNSLAILLGSLCGAVFLERAVNHREGYNLLFLTGSALRILTVLVFYWITRRELSFFREQELETY